MTPTTHALLICLTFLCGLEETVLSVSQLGICSGNQCFALFQKPVDFPGAQKSCNDAGGQLLATTFALEMETLLRGLSGEYWLAQSAEEAAAGLQNCSSVSAMAGHGILPVPCREKVSGFMCQYTVKEPCRSVQARKGAKVTYTTHMGFEVIDSEKFPLESAVFPPGTIGIVQMVGDKYPDSKQLCFSMKWTRAPWSCEVMQGGCEHSCNSASCICPAGKTLHPNNSFTCTDNPCADCAHLCQKEGDTHVCSCNKGYRLAQDGKSCVDVDECKEESPCANEGEECVNMEGQFQCQCADGFEEEDGACLDVSICLKCEHMKCDKDNGVYKCGCRKGFRVTAKDPTKCEMDCTEKDCLASCVQDADQEQKDLQYKCFCPDGYIVDDRNGTNFCTDINECENEQQCEHICENLFGSYRCLCKEGFELYDEYMCVRPGEDESESTPAPPIPDSVQPAMVPPYIKTGSVLGITVFLAMGAALVFYLTRNIVKRCGKFELAPIKAPDMDIFYLQQVTTETYKKLSCDKQFKNDPQRL